MFHVTQIQVKLLNIVLVLLFISCDFNKNNDNLLLTHKSNLKENAIYPRKIIEYGLQKEFDNAVWMFYASNIHGKISYIDSKSWELKESNIIYFDVELRNIIISNDTISITITPVAVDTTIKNFQLNQNFRFYKFLFKRGNSEVIARIPDGFNTKGNSLLYYSQDSSKINLNSNTYNSLKSEGCYPLDEQEKLLIIELKRHKDTLAPTIKNIAILRNIISD